jgi:hypothetical protein
VRLMAGGTELVALERELEAVQAAPAAGAHDRASAKGDADYSGAL